MKTIKTVAAALTGLGILVIGTGLLGHDLQVLIGLGILAYGLAVFAGLALHDSILRLAELFDAWASWEPTSGRTDQRTNLKRARAKSNMP